MGEERAGTAAWTADGGRSWTLASQPPGGYRSAVAARPDGSFVGTGPGGTDCSRDGGRNWEALRDAQGARVPGFHALAPPWLVGSDGRKQRLPE